MPDGYEDLIEGVIIVASALLGERLIQGKQKDRPTEEEQKDDKDIRNKNKQDAQKEAERIKNQQGKPAEKTPANPTPGPKVKDPVTAPRPAQGRGKG